MTDQWRDLMGSYCHDGSEIPRRKALAGFEDALKAHDFVIVTYYRGIW